MDKLSWQWDFWLNVILGGFSFTVTLLLFEEPTDIPKSSFISKVKRVDWLGTFFSMGLVCCLLLGLSWGSAYGWATPHAYGSFIGAAISVIGLIIVEGWIASDPVSNQSSNNNGRLVEQVFFIKKIGWLIYD